MKWVKSENFIIDAQTGDIQCLLPQGDDKLRDKMIEVAPEMFTSIISFVEQMDSGKFAAKSIYNEFKQILERVPQTVIEDAKLQV
jgi:hypothetical protein